MPTTLFTRDGEQFVKIRDDDPGNCTVCGEPLIEAWFRWVNHVQDPEAPFGWDGTFAAMRHADGSPNHGEHNSPMTRNRCPECKGEALTYQDTGYGWIARCPCGWNKYTDSGD